MMFVVNKAGRRRKGFALGALLLGLLVAASHGWAQEAPRPMESSPIKPPMIKPPMTRAQNPSGGGVSSAPRRRRTVRRKRRARRTVKSVKPEFVDVPLGTTDAAGAGASGPPIIKPARRLKPISGGVLNGKAVTLPKPAYPEIARKSRAAGRVIVGVTIDEQGHVIEAHAVSGNQLLREAAVEAAREARFTPTLLSGQPVLVTGTISYDFVP